MKKNKIISLVLATVIMGGVATPISAFAQEIVTSDNLEDSSRENTDKEEVVYVNLNNNGLVDKVYAVNIFNSKNIVDYGDYSEVRNMNTNDVLNYSNGKIVTTNSSDKLYYEGVLENAEIPWNIDISYYLNGERISADKLAGSAGSLEIKISISSNEKCNSVFFENYALQGAVLLDTEKCANIESDEATIANVGSQKQLSYMILPNKGKEITIKADVKDFEMPSISLNGVRFNLDVDVNTDELTDKVKELTDAIDEINSGATTLKDGTSTLNGGTSDLLSGVDSLNSGVDSLNSGILKVKEGLETLNSKSSNLTDGSKKILDALNEINLALEKVNVSSESIAQLVSASSDIKKGIDNLVKGAVSLNSNIGYSAYKGIMSSNGLNIDSLQGSNTSEVNDIKSQIQSLTDTKNALIAEGALDGDSKVLAIENAISELTEIIGLLQKNSAAIGGVETYLNNVSTGTQELLTGSNTLQEKYGQFDEAIVNLSQKLSGLGENMATLANAISQLTAQYKTFDTGVNDYTKGVSALLEGYSKIVNGSTELKDGTKTLKDGANSLNSGASSLYEGTTKLSDGTGELNDKTSNLDGEINDEVDSMVNELTGNLEEVVSFVSEKNTNVESVQFVIKTPAIEKEKVESVEEKTENLSIWQRFINLFTKK